jgi:hypothetical protein
MRPCARQVGAEFNQLLSLGLAEWRTFQCNHGVWAMLTRGEDYRAPVAASV